jgi:hypothetical protein
VLQLFTRRTFAGRKSLIGEKLDVLMGRLAADREPITSLGYRAPRANGAYAKTSITRRNDNGVLSTHVSASPGSGALRPTIQTRRSLAKLLIL